MRKIEIMIRDLPDDLLSKITDDLIHYTVGLFRNKQQLGSGTLIKCGDRFGILTAHHVVHRHTPPLDLSPSSSQNLVLAIIKSRHSFEIPAKYIREIEIGTPVSDEYGPDLTFLEFPSGDKLSTLQRYKSFWNLDHDTDKRLASTLKDDGVWVIIGIPNEWLTSQRESENKTQIHSKMIGFFGSAKSDSRYESGGFDFVNIEVNYGGRDQPPSSFGGMSGGGLWKVKFKYVLSKKNWEYDKPIFCGVPFYQEANVDGKRIVRCHYARSVYERVRNVLLEPNHDLSQKSV